MSKVGIVLISHSSKVTEGINDIISQVAKDVPIALAGGTDEDAIGTDVKKITAAIDQVSSEAGVILFYDLGSAKMNAEVAMEFTGNENIQLAEAPILEGVYVAAVES